MKRIPITLTDASRMNHVPLAALGYAYRHADLLAPLYADLQPMKTLTHSLGDKLTEALVLILAGGRATAQVDLLLRPNVGLARAWGQTCFAQQATLAEALDALTDEAVQHLQAEFCTWMQTWSYTCQHDFRRGPLIFDGDLTGLPASRRAEGSTKGYFAGKKMARAANLRGSASSRMAKPSARSCIRVRKPA